jgi:hypothetical protein
MPTRWLGLREVAILAIGVAGLAMCLTLTFLGMRAPSSTSAACVPRAAPS